ncbi:MAG: collagen-like protein [Thermoleophilia bacterium]|nr:collagen-like protein [Thermoleophilia bacterium]
MNDTRIRLLRPSPALVVASLALLIALSGTSWAAVALPRGSVGTPQLKAGAVTSPKVRNGSLQAIDLAPAARQLLKGQTGPQGPAGPRGEQGPSGLRGLELVTASSAFDSAREKTVVVSCPPGKRLLGGGGGAWGRAMIWVTERVILTASQPLDDHTWLAAARELDPTDEDWFVRVTAICGSVN